MVQPSTLGGCMGWHGSRTRVGSASVPVTSDFVSEERGVPDVLNSCQDREAGASSYGTLRWRAHNREKGFTPIELLIVVAIIAILAAMIFSVLAAVRERAHGATCASNMRQIGTAILAYTADWDDQLYPGGSGTADYVIH